MFTIEISEESLWFSGFGKQQIEFINLLHKYFQRSNEQYEFQRNFKTFKRRITNTSKTRNISVKNRHTLQRNKVHPRVKTDIFFFDIFRNFFLYLQSDLSCSGLGWPPCTEPAIAQLGSAGHRRHPHYLRSPSTVDDDQLHLFGSVDRCRPAYDDASWTYR